MSDGPLREAPLNIHLADADALSTVRKCLSNNSTEMGSDPISV